MTGVGWRGLEITAVRAVAPNLTATAEGITVEYRWPDLRIAPR